jgi:hypothetical protein
MSSDECRPENLPNVRWLVILQPGVKDRNGWPNIIHNGTWALFRTDLDCWTWHECDSDACDEFREDANNISTALKGRFHHEFNDAWAEARAELEEWERSVGKVV